MNLLNWAQWMGWLAAETGLIVLGAEMLQIFLHSPRARRTIWQAALTSAGLVLLAECGGLREKMAGPDQMLRHHFILVSSAVSSPAPATMEPLTAPAETAQASLPKAPLVKWPGWLWLAGAGMLLTRSFAARLWLEIRRHSAAPASKDSSLPITRLQKSLGLARVRAQVWIDLRSPVAFGVLRPTVALPLDFVTRFSSAEQEAMLAHEMAHLAARDPFWLLVSDVVSALAWWNPLVWWARRRLRVASECAADEASALLPGGPCALAECLVRLGREIVANGPARSLGVAGQGTKSQLAFRIRRLLGESQTWRPVSMWARWVPQFSAVVVAMISALLPIQCGSILVFFATPVGAQVASPRPSPIVAAVVTPEVPTNPPVTAAAVSNRPTETPTFKIAPTGSGALAYQWLFNGANLSNGTIDPVVPPPRKRIKLEVRSAIVTEAESDNIGLDWIFGVAPTNNPAMEISHDWNMLKKAPAIPKGFPSGPTNDHPRNVTVDHIRNSGQSVILSPPQFAALCRRVHADVLTAPATCFSGSETRLMAQDLHYLVTGVEWKTNAVNYYTDPVGTGLSVTIRSTAEDNDKWRLSVAASFSQFLGYDGPGATLISPLPSAGGKPVRAVRPLPHLRLVEADADSSIPLGQTLAIRGPLWTETNTIKTITAYFFKRTQTTTARQRLYLFVTPAPAL